MKFDPSSGRFEMRAAVAVRLLRVIRASIVVAAAPTVTVTVTVRSVTGKMVIGRNARRLRSTCAMFCMPFVLDVLIPFRRCCNDVTALYL